MRAGGETGLNHAGANEEVLENEGERLENRNAVFLLVALNVYEINVQRHEN